MGHDGQSAVLKPMCTKGLTFTVTDADQVNEHFARTRFADGGMPKTIGAPTMWPLLRVRTNQRRQGKADGKPSARDEAAFLEAQPIGDDEVGR